MDNNTNNQGGGDWSSHPTEKPDEPASLSYADYSKQNQSGKKEMGSLDDSTKLIPEIKSNVALFASYLKGPILYAIAAILAIRLLFSVLVAGVSVVLGIAEAGPTLFSVLGGFEAFVGVFFGFAASVYTYAFFRIGHDRLTGLEQEPPASIKDAIQSVTPVMLSVVLAVLVSHSVTAIGTLMCIVPGVLAFVVLSPSRYLAATRPDLGFQDVLDKSITTGMRYWGAMVGLLAVIVAVIFVQNIGLAILEAISTAIMAAAVDNFGAVAFSLTGGILSIVVAIASFVLGLLTMVVAFCVEGGVMSVLTRQDNV